MTKRRTVPTAPEPLEDYARHFDALFGKSNQRDEFRYYLEGLLLPTERHKTLTGLANTEPLVGAHLPRAQKLQWFLSESNWDERKVQAQRLTVLREDPSTAPNGEGVLVIDETGDRKDGHKTAHVSRQYLANLGKIDNGVVSVTSLWADEQVYYPLEVEPYTPESYFAKGKNDPNFRTKLKIALQLVQQAVQQGWPFRAVVADNFYGEDRGLKSGLRELNVPYVMALKPSHAWYHPQDEAGTLQDVAHEAGWVSAEQPGQWRRIRRTFRDGSTQDWWALEIVAGPYGPDKKERPSWRAPIRKRCPISPPGIWSPTCPRPWNTLKVSRCFPQPVSKRSSGSMGYACGWSRATSRSNMLWAGRSTKYEATRRSDDIGNSSAVPSRSAGITPVTPLTTRRQLLWSRLCHPFLRNETFLFKKQERGKKISENNRQRPRMSWPVALRAVRGWLEPWIMLRRYWHGWSRQLPPAELQLLLHQLEHGQPIALYSSA